MRYMFQLKNILFDKSRQWYFIANTVRSELQINKSRHAYYLRLYKIIRSYSIFIIIIRRKLPHNPICKQFLTSEYDCIFPFK